MGGPVKTLRRHCCSIAGGRVVKGWPWDSGSHTNTVVALLHWKGGGLRGLSPEKVGKYGVSGAF